MEDYPRTFMELDLRFATDAVRHDFLARVRWPQGPFCSACARTEGLVDGAAYGCAWLRAPALAGAPDPLALGCRALWWVTSRKNGNQRAGTPTRPRAGQLPHGLDLARQASPLGTP